mmetsp:Transcript_26503/g.94521  ORF Transcript_26503/g.94521 Transcript_26503/m.94521 type:complete len:221 (-) Transcript_26503:10-672(-)
MVSAWSASRTAATLSSSVRPAGPPQSLSSKTTTIARTAALAASPRFSPAQPPRRLLNSTAAASVARHNAALAAASWGSQARSTSPARSVADSPTAKTATTPRAPAARPRATYAAPFGRADLRRRAAQRRGARRRTDDARRRRRRPTRRRRRRRRFVDAARGSAGRAAPRAAGTAPCPASPHAATTQLGPERRLGSQRVPPGATWGRARAPPPTLVHASYT